MSDSPSTPLKMLRKLLLNAGQPYSVRELSEEMEMQARPIRKILNRLVRLEVLKERKISGVKKYWMPEDPPDDRLLSLLHVLSEEEARWLDVQIDEEEAEDLAPLVLETAGSISRFLDHMVFLEEIASIILTSRKFPQVFRETFRRLFSAVDFDIGFAVTVESELRVHMIHKTGISDTVKAAALRSMREMLNLVVALPFIPSEYGIQEEIEEMQPAPQGTLQHRIGASFERDRMTPGMLALFRMEDRPFLADEKQVLDVLGSQMSLACRNINAMERIRQLSLTDDLTGISNKRHFRLMYNAEFERARRYQYPLALCMMDLDHFKRINDRFGHQQGDVVLSEIAALILRQVRVTDQLARYGGDEFMLLLPHTELEQCRELAEKICRSVGQNEFPGESAPIHCTISIGLTSLGPGDLTPEDLIERADRLMYQAKSQGRNLVISE